MLELIQGDSREVLPTLPADSVDSVVTDPPYALTTVKRFGLGQAEARTPTGRRLTGGFMGKTWDSEEVVHDPAFWAEVLRVLKPGGHLVAFGGARTFHRLTFAIEDAGFEIRDCLSWLYGQGFPKSLDVSKAIDKAAGAEREVVGRKPDPRYNSPATATSGAPMGHIDRRPNSVENYARAAMVTAPSTEGARRWNGWGTALKPAWEPIILARKPLAERSVAANVLAHGTGAVNVDACRIDYQGTADQAAAIPQGRVTSNAGAGSSRGDGTERREFTADNTKGRWPANVVLDEEAARLLDEQSGERPSGYTHNLRRGRTTGRGMGYHSSATGDSHFTTYGDAGGASRFFYCPKAANSERSKGLDARNTHPTVKPLALMMWLVKLVTPPKVACLVCGDCGGTVEYTHALRSGTTAEPRGRQPAGKSPRAPESGPRRPPEAAEAPDHLSTLPLDDPDFGPCPACGGRLAPGEHAGRVLDPFLGSGTTAIAAHNAGFSCIGVEREADYINLADQRIRAACKLESVE